MSEFKKANLAKIKEKVEKSGIMRTYYIESGIPLYKPKEEDNYIRILPPVGEMDDFGLDIWVHSYLGPERGNYLCVERSELFGVKRKKCLLCDLYRRMQGKDEEMVRQIAPRRRTLYWVLDISDKPQSEEPMIFDAPYRQVAEEILMRCIDRRTGEIIDISDLENGREVYFRVDKKSRKYPEYRGVEVGRKFPISPKLAKKIKPLYEVVVIPDEAEIVELVDLLYETGRREDFSVNDKEDLSINGRRGFKEEEEEKVKSRRRYGYEEEEEENMEMSGNRNRRSGWEDEEDEEDSVLRMKKRLIEEDEDE